MKLYDLKPWQKITLWNKVYKFIKIDWVYGNWEDEEWNFIIGFHAADNIDKFLINNKNKNGETRTLWPNLSWEKLGV